MDSMSLEKRFTKQDLPEAYSVREFELRTSMDSSINYALAIATFGALLHRYAGPTPVAFDVTLVSESDGDAIRTGVELTITSSSTLVSLAATVDDVILQRVGEGQSFACMLPESLARYFRLDTMTNEDDRPIAVIFSNAASPIRAVLQYIAELHDETMITQLARHLERLLNTAAVAPTSLVSELPMMTSDDLNRVLSELNGTTIEFERVTIPEAFEAYLNTTPEAAALKFDNRVITYRELHARALQVARALQQHGIGIESLVGVYVDDPVVVASIYFGIVIAGGALVPLDTEWPQDRLHQVIQNAEIHHIITTEDLAPSLPFDSDRKLVYGDLIANSTAWTFVRPRITPDNAAYVVPTSGSTGLPKLVVGLHRSITGATAVDLPMTKDDVFALSANLTFGAAVLGLFRPLIQGATVLLVPSHLSRDLPRLVECWEQASVTRVVIVAPRLRQLCMLSGIKERLKKVKIIILSGAALNADDLPAVYDNFPQATVVNSYTCIEVGTMTTRWVSPPTERRHSITIGNVLPNIRVYILSSDGSTLPLGMPGEIYVGSADLCRGYLNQPESTRQRFLPNPFPSPGIPRVYRTGDIGRWRPDGELEYLGRLDNQVKVHGNRVELDEIELFLYKHPDVQDAAVVAVPREGDFRLNAFVTPKLGRTLSVTDLRRHVVSVLPSYCVPAVFVIMEELPLTRNGKIDRQNLPKIDGKRPQIDTPFVAPGNSIEDTIRAVWQQEFAFDGIGVNDHFLEIGGESMVALRITLRLQEALGVDVFATSIFEYPTIAELAAHLTSGESINLCEASEPLRGGAT